MTKSMSMLLIMEAVDSGKLSLEDDIIISKTAADWVEVKSSYKKEKPTS